jgi:hypothetical protein
VLPACKRLPSSSYADYLPSTVLSAHLTGAACVLLRSKDGSGSSRSRFEVAVVSRSRNMIDSADGLRILPSSRLRARKANSLE